MEKSKIIWVIIGILAIVMVASSTTLFSLYGTSNCGTIGTLMNGGTGADKMCLPNGQWSGWLDCHTGKCGIRVTSNIPGWCGAWLDLKCLDDKPYLYMCGRNGVWSSLGKISGYCGYNSPTVPVVLDTTDTHTTIDPTSGSPVISPITTETSGTTTSSNQVMDFINQNQLLIIGGIGAVLVLLLFKR